MTGAPNELGPMPSYEEIQVHIERARAMRAQCIAQSMRSLGRLIAGRGAETAAAPHGARTA